VVPDGPAGVRVGKMHSDEIVVGPALLWLPAGPAVAAPVETHVLPTQCNDTLCTAWKEQT
jgi:hypothetical protein